MIGAKLKAIWEFTKDTFEDWIDDKAPRLAAALSYYTLFSLAPILIIAIVAAGLVFGEDTARQQIITQLQALVGEPGAKAVEVMLENARQPANGVPATIIGIVTLLIGATGAFVELQDALNTVWEVRPKAGQGIKGLIRERVLSFGMILGVGFLLLVSLVISAGISAADAWLKGVMPGYIVLAHVTNLVVSFAVATLLFAMIFKILPDVKLSYRDVGIGAAVTAALFTLGKTVIGIYLGRSSVASAYGAAGSVVVLLLWIYYSSLIVLLGAEFTQIYAEWTGQKIEPTEYAEYTPEHEVRVAARARKRAAPKPGSATAPTPAPAPAPIRENPATAAARSAARDVLRITPLPAQPKHRRFYYS